MLGRCIGDVVVGVGGLLLPGSLGCGGGWFGGLAVAQLLLVLLVQESDSKGLLLVRDFWGVLELLHEIVGNFLWNNRLLLLRWRLLLDSSASSLIIW